MRNFKKVIAGALALLMLALSVNVSFAAENYSDKEAIVVAKVNAAGIMEGTDKGFEPSKSLTRAEAAAIMVRLKGIAKATVDQNAGTTLFNDVAASHWAAGYINVASNYNIIKGVGAGKFAPEKEVTVAEFYTMAVRALGAGQLVEAEGTWPTNYVNFAIENDLAKDVAQIYTATATRMSAATIIANTLEAPLWEKTNFKSNGEITWGKSVHAYDANNKPVFNTIRSEVLTLREGTIVVDALSNNDKTVSAKNTTDITIEGVSKITAKTYDVREAFNLASVKVGLKYTFWIDDEDEIQGLWIEKEDTINFTAITSVDDIKSEKEISLKVDGKEVVYEINPSGNFYKNEGNAATLSTLSKNKNAVGTAYLVDGKIDSMYFTDYTVFSFVDEVTTKKVKMQSSITGAADSSIDISCDKCEYFLTKDGEAFDFADLEEGDVICYYVKNLSGSHKKYVGEVVTDIVKGEVTSSNSGKSTIAIDGTKYDVTSAVAGNMPKLEDKITAVLNHEGKVVAYKKDEGSASDAAIIKYLRSVSDKYNDNNYEVELLYSDGTSSERLTVDLDETFDELKDAAKVSEVIAEDLTSVNYDGKASQSIDNGKKVYAYTKSSTTYYFSTKSKAAYAYLTADEDFDLAKAICYNVSGSELTVKALSDKEDIEFYTMGGSGITLTIGKKSAYIDTVAVYDKDDATNHLSDKRVFVDENTKFIKLKAGDDYSIKAEVLDFDSIDTTDLNAGSYIFDYDDANESAGVVVFALGTTIARATEANFVFVADTEPGKYNGEDVTVVWLVGQDEPLYASKEITGDADFANIRPGVLGDISLSGKEITGFDLLPQGSGQNAKANDYLTPVPTVYSYIKDLKEDKGQITIGTNTLTLADDVLVVKYDGKDYKASSLDDLVVFDADNNSNSLVAGYYTYKNTDNDVEVAAIVYYEVKNWTISYNSNSKTLTATSIKKVDTAADTVKIMGLEFTISIQGVEDTTYGVATYTFN